MTFEEIISLEEGILFRLVNGDIWCGKSLCEFRRVELVCARKYEPLGDRVSI